jgi:riboflavin biosynthesis pyrimidine reductase
MDLAALLVILRDHHHSSAALVEAGPRILESFLRAGLVDEGLAYVAATRQTRMPHTGPGALLSGFVHTRARPVGADMEHTFFRAATVSERP